jgi:hypothetical protein
MCQNEYKIQLQFNKNGKRNYFHTSRAKFKWEYPGKHFCSLTSQSGSVLVMTLLLPIIFPRTKTYLDTSHCLVSRIVRTKMNMPLMWEGVSCILHQWDSVICYLSDKFSGLVEVWWLNVTHKIYRMYLKCLDKLQERVPYTWKTKKISYQYISTNSFGGAAQQLVDLNPLHL